MNSCVLNDNWLIIQFLESCLHCSILLFLFESIFIDMPCTKTVLTRSKPAPMAAKRHKDKIIIDNNNNNTTTGKETTLTATSINHDNTFYNHWQSNYTHWQASIKYYHPQPLKMKQHLQLDKRKKYFLSSFLFK